MSSVIVKGKEGNWFLSAQSITQLKSSTLICAFREALAIAPDLDTTIWIDENNKTQKVMFKI